MYVIYNSGLSCSLGAFRIFIRLKKYNGMPSNFFSVQRQTLEFKWIWIPLLAFGRLLSIYCQWANFPIGVFKNVMAKCPQKVDPWPACETWALPP
jgi:hypothetical protein